MPENRKLFVLPLAAALFYLTVTLLCLDIPFFWDTVTFSKIATFFQDNGWNGMIPDPYSDTGNFPLYGAYIAVIRKVFGSGLAVSHLAFLPFLLGMVWQIFLLCKKFLSHTATAIVFILLVADPVFTTQGIYMAYDIILAFFALLALNALLEKKWILYAAALILTVFVSVRGIPMILSLAILHLTLLYLKKQENGNKFLPLLSYLPVLILFAAWLVYHKMQAGWYLFSPLRSGNDEGFTDANMAVRQIIYAVWKVSDLGRVFVWLAVLIPLVVWLKKCMRDKELLKLMLFAGFFLIIHVILMSVIRNPLSQRYFLVLYVVLLLIFGRITDLLFTHKLKLLLTPLLAAGLIWGNFWMYPERFGNGWDVSLKSLPVFALDKKMADLIDENDIDPLKVATDFPLFYDRKFWEPGRKSLYYADIEHADPDSYDYVLHSNVSNKFHPDKLNELQTQWLLLYELSSGQLYYRLYARKN
jgi:hypothetical protein